MALLSSVCLAGERGSPWVQVYEAQTIEGAHVSTHIAQLPDGRLVVANMSGLLRFDGVRWEITKHPRGLGGMEYLSLGPEAKIYTSFNGDIGYFQDDLVGALAWHSLLDRVPLAGRSFDAVQDVRHDWKRHGTWFGTREQVVFIPDGGEGTTIVPVQPSIRYSGLVGDEYWIQHAATKIVGRINPEAGFAVETIPGNELVRDYLVVSSATGDDDVKLATSEGRVLSYRDGHLSVWTDALVESRGHPGLRELVHLRDGRYVAGGNDYPVTVLDRNGRIVDRYDKDDGIPGQRRTLSLFEDREGDLWLAQDMTIVKVSLEKAVTFFDETRGLPSASGAVRWQGRLYVSGFVGLYRLDEEETYRGGHFEQVLPELTNVRMIAALDRDTLLVDSNGMHAITLDAKGKLIATPLTTASPREVFATSRFTPGRVWMGHANGVQSIDRAADGKLVVTDLPLLTSATYRIGEQDDHTLWVADRVAGVSRVDTRGNLPPRLYGPKDGLPEGQVRVYPGAHRPWFTTMLGLRVYDADSDRFVIPEGLPESLQRERLYAVYEDKDENLWVRGGQMLNELYWRTADGWRADGTLMYVVPPNPTIFGFLREDAIVWAVRANGLLRYDLAAHTALGAPALPILTGVQDVRAKTPVSISRLGALGTLVRDVRFEFALPVLNRPDATSYRSRLAGFDSGWSDWSAHGETNRVYTNLPDGDFRFEVEAQDAYLRLARMPDVAIGIAAPWWRTTWARILYGVAALLSLWFASRWGAHRRRHQYLQRQRELEAVVEQRTGELKSSNEQLAEQAQRLTEVDRLKTRFFINVGHEFRTPLTLVLGPIEDLLRDARERFSVNARERLEMVHRNARRVLDLIVELLDVNRFEHGQMRLTLATCDLSVLARRSLDDNRPVLERFGHQAELRIGGEGPWFAYVDPTQVERCLGNLLGNAAKYMARGGVVELAVCRIAGSIELSVTDQGRGIAQPAMPHVFDRFFQTEGHDSASGYGIGLSLVREIIEAHHGQVSVESTLGVGSTFTMRVPALSDANNGALDVQLLASEEKMESAGSDEDPSAISTSPRLPLVLLVDDHDDLRAHARRLLSDRYEMIEAADGLSAWNLARDRLPDLIVCDVMMPGIDGIELTRRLRADPDTAAIAILLLTAKVGSEHAVAGLGAGADDYLAKPFDASELLARIWALLARAHRLRLRLIREQEHGAPVEAGAKTPQERWRQKLDAAIAQHLDEPEFGIEALAGEMHADRSQLFRKCKELLGVSPSEYLRDERLRRGHTLLEQRAGNVSEVAYAVGFESLSSFTRAFKTRYGYPPSQVGMTRKAV